MADYFCKKFFSTSPNG